MTLVAERASARAERDFHRADALRARIEALGYDVRDSPEGSWAEPRQRERLEPSAIADRLSEPASLPFSFHVLYEGYPDDLERFLVSFSAHHPDGDAEIVVVDPGSSDAEHIDRLVARTPGARTVALRSPIGWAAARNAGLKTSRGALIALVDLSVEVTGDLLTPLGAVFADPDVGVAGPFGLVTEDLREFSRTDGTVAHAIEGYLLVARRASFARALIHERFTWYRNADIDLSFQIRGEGFAARVADLPVQLHEHRGWTDLGDQERRSRSRRNHAILLKRWSGRPDLVERLS